MQKEKRATLRGEEGCPGNGVQLVEGIGGMQGEVRATPLAAGRREGPAAQTFEDDCFGRATGRGGRPFCRSPRRPWVSSMFWIQSKRDAKTWRCVGRNCGFPRKQQSDRDL